MNEIFEYQAILLERKKSSEYNDTLRFFTRENGITFAYGFGTRSPKSSRNKDLSSFDFLKISLEKNRTGLILKDTKIIYKLDFLNKIPFYNLYLTYLKNIYNLLPENNPEKDIFDFMYHLAGYLNKIKHISPVLTILFYSMLLKKLGYFPYFEKCDHCGIDESAYFIYSLNSQNYLCAQCSSPSSAMKLHTTELKLINYLYTIINSENISSIEKLIALFNNKTETAKVETDPLENILLFLKNKLSLLYKY